MYKQFQEGNTFRGKAGPCGQPPPPKTLQLLGRHTGFAWLQLPAGQSPAGLTHLQSHVGQLWLWSSNLQLLPRQEGSSDRANPNRSAGVGRGAPLRSRLVHRFTFVQSTVLAMQLYISWHLAQKGTKNEPESALSSQVCEVLHPLWRGLPPAARSGRISRISAKNQVCVHGSCIGPCSPGVFESVNITTCLLLPGLDHSGYAPISA